MQLTLSAQRNPRYFFNLISLSDQLANRLQFNTNPLQYNESVRQCLVTPGSIKRTQF